MKRKINEVDEQEDIRMISLINSKEKEIKRIILETHEKRLEQMRAIAVKGGKKRLTRDIDIILNKVGVAIEQINPSGFITAQYCSSKVKEEIIDMFAMGWSVKDVTSHIKQYYLVDDINWWTMSAIKKRNKRTIAIKAHEYLMTKEPGRFDTGAGRVEELTDLYNECRKVGEYAVARGVMKLIREERENIGKELSVTLNGHVDTTHKVDPGQLKEMAMILAAKRVGIPMEKIAEAKFKVLGQKKKDPDDDEEDED